MAKNTQLSNALINGQGDYLATQLNNGYLRIYSGAQPTNADTGLSGQTLLAELRFANPAAGASVAGVVTFSAITGGTGLVSDTATWFRCLKSDGSSVMLDGTVGLSAATPNLVLNSTAISSGATVNVTSFVHTVEKATSGA